MFWHTETPIVITSNPWILPILKKPIHWLWGTCNVWTQYGLYLLNIARYDSFTAKKIFDTYDILVSNDEKIRIARTKHIDNPKIIVLFCHTVFGSYGELSHIPKNLKNESVVYFSYSRRGVHQELHTKYYNVVGSTEILDNVINHIQNLYPNTNIHAVGASAGTCLLTRYLSTKNSTKKITSAVFISPGYHFIRSIFEMPDSVRARLLKQLKLKYHHCVHPKLMNSKTLIEWVQHHHTTTEYNTTDEYIVNNDPLYFLKSINVPTLMISALDDFCFPGSVTKQFYNLPFENNNITMAITKHGGHISFIDYGSQIPWSSRVVLEHIKSKLIL